MDTIELIKQRIENYKAQRLQVEGAIAAMMELLATLEAKDAQPEGE
jgi:hypothetical protein